MDSRKYQNAITRVAEYYDITVSDVETAIDIYLKGKLPPSEEQKERPVMNGYSEEFVEWFKEDVDYFKCIIDGKIGYVSSVFTGSTIPNPQLTMAEIYDYWQSLHTKSVLTMHDINEIDKFLAGKQLKQNKLCL